MERKVFAKIEFQQRRKEMFQPVGDSSCENICTFQPSDMVLCSYEYPLKLMIPSDVTETCCQWVYTITFGGGLVEGDNVNISFKIGEKCCVLYTTLSYPKVYCCENKLESQQHGDYFVDSEALLCVLPDPLVAFAKSSYSQTQQFYLKTDSNLVLLDWFTSGRYCKGERWEFSKLRSISTVFINGDLEFREAQNMQDTPLLSIKSSMKSFDIIGTCMVIGPQLEFLYTLILKELGRCQKFGEELRDDFLFAVSSLNLYHTSEKVGCIIRFAAVSVPEAMKKIEELLKPLFPILGGNPFANK